MKKLFESSNFDTKDFFERIRREHESLMKEKSKFYNFDFEKGLPLEDSNSKLKNSIKKARYKWEPVNTVKSRVKRKKPEIDSLNIEEDDSSKEEKLGGNIFYRPLKFHKSIKQDL